MQRPSEAELRHYLSKTNVGEVRINQVIPHGGAYVILYVVTYTAPGGATQVTNHRVAGFRYREPFGLVCNFDMIAS